MKTIFPEESGYSSCALLGKRLVQLLGAKFTGMSRHNQGIILRDPASSQAGDDAFTGSGRKYCASQLETPHGKGTADSWRCFERRILVYYKGFTGNLLSHVHGKPVYLLPDLHCLRQRWREQNSSYEYRSDQIFHVQGYSENDGRRVPFLLGGSDLVSLYLLFPDRMTDDRFFFSAFLITQGGFDLLVNGQ